MTANANLKRAVRDRMAATGENYTRALRATISERAAMTSDDERNGTDTGPCASFTPQTDNPTRCARCGYGRGAHR